MDEWCRTAVHIVWGRIYARCNLFPKPHTNVQLNSQHADFEVCAESTRSEIRVCRRSTKNWQIKKFVVIFGWLTKQTQRKKKKEKIEWESKGGWLRANSDSVVFHSTALRSKWTVRRRMNEWWPAIVYFCHLYVNNNNSRRQRTHV